MCDLQRDDHAAIDYPVLSLPHTRSGNDRTANNGFFAIFIWLFVDFFLLHMEVFVAAVSIDVIVFVVAVAVVVVCRFGYHREQHLLDSLFCNGGVHLLTHCP